MFHLNALVIAKLARALNKHLAGKTIESCFSINKYEWFLATSDFCFKVQFFKNNPFFFFPEADKLPKKNSLAFNKQLEGRKVVSVESVALERILLIHLSSNFTLVFQLFGSKSDILLYHKKMPLKSFVFQNNPIFKEYDVLTHSIEVEDMDIDLKTKKIPYIPKETVERLLSAGQETIQLSALIGSAEKSLDGPYYILEEETPKLSIQPGEGKKYDSIIEAIHAFSIKYIAASNQKSKENLAQTAFEKQLKGLEKKRLALEANILRLQTKVPYKEMADILMANMYAIEKGAEQVTLHNFYNDLPITIALNPQLNAQQNAERYYRKGKNEHKQVEIAQQQLQAVNDKLEQLNAHPIEATSIQTNSKAKVEEQPNFAYILTVDDYEIWVGKNAKSNDEIVRRAYKEDIWLHARGYRGAHVIIRCGKADKPSLHTIEKVAAIAAFNSEGKSSHLVPVIYTLKKFVRKGKGMAPGQVMVDKEEVILVEPVKP